ncbi:hypothetical protein OCEANICA350_12514 [Oceanicaulis sp. 350]|nr:hypothetical protein OCEANICA350_12514 [Oceanicaulis sp. 350]
MAPCDHWIPACAGKEGDKIRPSLIRPLFILPYADALLACERADRDRRLGRGEAAQAVGDALRVTGRSQAMGRPDRRFRKFTPDYPAGPVFPRSPLGPMGARRLGVREGFKRWRPPCRTLRKT